MMPSKRGKNLWERWEKAITDYKAARKNFDSEWLQDWPRRLLVLFMEQINKNIFHESFDTLLDKIIEALQVVCGFERVRIFFINEKKPEELVLYKTSAGHQPPLHDFKINIEKKHGEAIDTLKTGNPLSIEDSNQIYLHYGKKLKIKGSFASIPLLVEGKPYGLIAADKIPTALSGEKGKKPVQFYEYQEHFGAFARIIMAAIENRKIFDQRNQKINQLEAINTIDEIIQSEEEEKELLRKLTEYSGQLVNADGGHLKIVNQRTGKLERVADYGQDIAPPYITDKPKDIDFSYYILETMKPLLLDDVTNHPIMKKHKKYCIDHGFTEYLQCLENRKSALIVPLITRKGKIIGVLDLHARQVKKFSEADKENLLILVNSVIHAVEKVQQIEEQKQYQRQREKISEVMHEAMGRTDHLPSLLEIIRDSIFNSEIFEDKVIMNLCLYTRDSQSGELRPASYRWFKDGKDCIGCTKTNYLVKNSILMKKMQLLGREFALPFLSKGEVIAVLYLLLEKEINLTESEKKILDLFEKGISILITTTMNQERKIKQMTAFYEAGKLTTTSDYREWFNVVMEKVMDVIGRENRNFHLILLEEHQGEQMLIIRQTSALFVDGEKISLENEILGSKFPLEGSLSGNVINEKRWLMIADIRENRNLPEGHPIKLPFFPYDEIKEIRSEVAFPLIIKEGETEKVIGTLVIDSVIPHDFHNLDIQFVETIAQYLAIAIHNQQLYDERALYQERINQLKRSAEMEVFSNYFFHQVKNPLQEIISGINIIKMKYSHLKDDDTLERIEKGVKKLSSSYRESIRHLSQNTLEKETIEIKKMIDNSIYVLKKTSGLATTIKGNYNESSFEIECYPVFMEMAFRELITNAIKFSEGLEGYQRYLEINVNSTDNNHAVITFKNSTLQPIPKDKIESIFIPFVQGVKDDRGLGLGLALIKFFVDRHSGKISIENVEGEKAVCVTIEIPKKIKI